MLLKYRLDGIFYYLIGINYIISTLQSLFQLPPPGRLICKTDNFDRILIHPTIISAQMAQLNRNKRSTSPKYAFHMSCKDKPKNSCLYPANFCASSADLSFRISIFILFGFRFTSTKRTVFCRSLTATISISFWLFFFQ